MLFVYGGDRVDKDAGMFANWLIIQRDAESRNDQSREVKVGRMQW
jgi:hypothetical protein